MRVFRGFEEAAGIINPVVTTGSFDGVHVGHKTIIGRLNTLAKKYGGESVLVTFHPHPRKVLYPDTLGKDLKLINSQEEKIHLLSLTGLDNIIFVEFTRDFSRVTSEEFVRDYLKAKLDAKVIVVGFNHHFGFNKEGDYRQLWNLRSKYGFEAEEIPEQEVENETVSSTRIRKALSEGYIQRANAYLDHHFIVIGKPVSDSVLSGISAKEFFLVPVTDESKQLPPCGIYAVTADWGKVSGKAMVIVNNDFSDRPAVYVHPLFPVENGSFDIILRFQKRIGGAVNLKSAGMAASRINTAITETDELIY